MAAETPRTGRRRVLCIVGAARTGTHLMNSVLSASPLVPPVLPESAPILTAVEALQTTLGQLSRNPGSYYATEPEAVADYAAVVRNVVERVCERTHAEICVLRNPALTRVLPLLRTVLSAGGCDSKFICMVRDPRDAVASMRVWQERRSKLGQPLSFGGTESVEGLADLHWQYYVSALRDFAPEHGEAIRFVRYEDLVEDPYATAGEVGGFAELDLGAFDPDAAWSRTTIDYRQLSAENASITPLFQGPMAKSSIGGWKRSLSSGEAEAVLTRCRPLVNRFYPDLAS